MNRTKLLKDAATKALAVQDACNLSGVVHSFSQVLTECLWPLARENGLGTLYVNTHPISQLFAYKISALSGQEHLSSPVFDDAWHACEILSQNEEYECD